MSRDPIRSRTQGVLRRLSAVPRPTPARHRPGQTYSLVSSPATLNTLEDSGFRAAGTAARGPHPSSRATKAECELRLSGERDERLVSGPTRRRAETGRRTCRSRGRAPRACPLRASRNLRGAVLLLARHLSRRGYTRPSRNRRWHRRRVNACLCVTPDPGSWEVALRSRGTFPRCRSFAMPQHSSSSRLPSAYAYPVSVSHVLIPFDGSKRARAALADGVATVRSSGSRMSAGSHRGACALLQLADNVLEPRDASTGKRLDRRRADSR